jgi:hypothetical protein
MDDKMDDMMEAMAMEWKNKVQKSLDKTDQFIFKNLFYII